MPREVYTFTYKDYDYNYLPLAPVSNDNKISIAEVYSNTPFEIFNKNNKSVGNIFFSGQTRNISDKKLLNLKLYNETAIIYFNEEDNTEDISYVSFDIVIFKNKNEKPINLPFTQKATATGGRFAGKNVTITEERVVDKPEKTYRLIIKY